MVFLLLKGNEESCIFWFSWVLNRQARAGGETGRRSNVLITKRLLCQIVLRQCSSSAAFESHEEDCRQ